MGSKKNRNGPKRFVRAVETRDWRRLSFEEAAQGMCAIFHEGEHTMLLEMLETRHDGKELARQPMPVKSWSGGRMEMIDLSAGGIPVSIDTANLLLMSALTMSKEMLLKAMGIANVCWNTRIEPSGEGHVGSFSEFAVLAVCCSLSAQAHSKKSSDEMREVLRERGLSILRDAAAGSFLTPFPAREGDVLLPSKGDPVEMARLMKDVPDALKIFLEEMARREGGVLGDAIDEIREKKAEAPAGVKSWKDKVA